MQTTQSPKAGERTQHTPGPWKIRITRGAENDTKHVWVTGEHGGAIAELFGSAKIDDIKAEVDARKEANARLIAAAPELLEALRGIQWKIQAYGSHWEASESERIAINAAIAKAEGTNL